MLKKVNYFEAGLGDGRHFRWMIDYIFPELQIDNFHAYGFEPCEEVFNQLTTVFKNSCNTTLLKKAISDNNEVSKFYHAFNKKGHYYSDGNSLIENIFTNNSIYENVECIRFSDWIKENVPDFQNSFNIFRTNMEGSEWNLLLDLKNSGLLQYINIFCGSDTEGEMNRSISLRKFIPEFKIFIQENSIEQIPFVYQSDIEIILEQIQTKYFGANINTKIQNPTKEIKKAIYLIIIGDYDELHEPLIITPGWDYICFSDQNIKSKTWQIRKIEGDSFLSNAMLSRKINILIHWFLPDYDITIGVPGYSVIKVNLDKYIDEYFSEDRQKTCDMAVLTHPRRRRIYEEANFWKIYGKDPFGIIEKQMESYKDQGIPNIRIGACGVLVRKSNNRRLEKFCELWWEEVLKHSHQDQISFPFVLWKYNLINVHWIKFSSLELCFRNNNIHHKVSSPYVINYNSNLIDLCNNVKNKDIVIEMGCLSGNKTSTFLKLFTKVYAIDTWSKQENEENFDKMRNFSNNIIKIKAESKDAIKQIKNSFADMVYINNEYIKDIQLWITKVKKNGFIAGSHYTLVKDIVIKEIGNPDNVFSDDSWIKMVS